MSTPTAPITWNQRLNAWDSKTIEALQERLIRSVSIKSEIAALFAQTMQWGKIHAFDARDTDTLLSCWTMLVLGSNVPWLHHDAENGRNFLATIVQSNPQGVLDHLNKRVYARLKDREQSAAWIAQALHVACELDAALVAPTLWALAKTWSGDIKRSQDFANIVGKLGRHFPWDKMQALYTKFQAQPDIKKAILQWDGLCTADRVFQASRIDKGANSPNDIFATQGEASTFHARSLALDTSGMHLARQWGIPFIGKKQVDADKISLETKRAMESTWEMLRETAMQTAVACDRAMLQKAAGWCMDHIPETMRVIRYEKADAILLGDKPYFTKAIDQLLALHEKKGDRVGPQILEVLTYANPLVQKKYRPFLSACVRDHLLDLIDRNTNAIISPGRVPLLMPYLSSENVVGLSHIQKVNEQRLFWQIIEHPEQLNEHTRNALVQTIEVKKAILLVTLMESHGVEHWNIAEDPDSIWMRTLPIWYPQAMPAWEHVLREHLRWPSTARDVLLGAVFDVQDIPRQRWDVIQHMVDAPAPNKDWRQAKSDVRSWKLGLPQSSMGMGWVMDALHASAQACVSFPLPILDEPVAV